MEDKKLSIRIAGNTMNVCLLVLRDKGYELSCWQKKPDEPHQWDAEKDGRAFSADSPEALLGLVAMWESRGDDWHMKSDEAMLLDLIHELPAEDVDQGGGS